MTSVEGTRCTVFSTTKKALKEKVVSFRVKNVGFVSFKVNVFLGSQLKT